MFVKIIGYIVSAIFIFFGVLFVLAAFSPNGAPGYIITGIILALIGFAIIFFILRRAKDQAEQNVTLKIDLPANVQMDSMKCKSCGGVLSHDNISMVAGAPVVTCPFCDTVYQLTEDVKW